MSDHPTLFPDDPPARKKPGPKPRLTPEERRQNAINFTRRRRERLVAKGICTQCARGSAAPGQQNCDPCQAKCRARYHVRIASGLCTCGGPLRNGRKRCEACRTYGRQHMVAKRRRLKAEGLCIKCGRPPESGLTLCDFCRAREATNKLAVRREAFDAYGGPRCVCCGCQVFEFLTLDHVDGDGAKHRRELSNGYTGYAFYRKLKKFGFPKTPRLVVNCFNCNIARRCFGTCPCQRTNQ